MNILDEEMLALGKNFLFPALTVTLTEAEGLEIQAKLWRLLGRRAALYTLNDSSSVPEETARQLFKSICFTLTEAAGENGGEGNQKLLLREDPDALLDKGQKVLQRRTEAVKKLWEQACLTAPEPVNLALRDTLKDIGGFFRRYDRYFMAHQIPCVIDYPLCRPVPETLLGVEYIGEYLRRIIAENRVLRNFPSEVVKALMKAECTEYRVLPLNLCLPVLTNAVGLLLIGREPVGLDITEADRVRLAALLEPMPEGKARDALRRAGQRLCGMAEITEDGDVSYVAETAKDLYPRLNAALRAGNLANVFLPLRRR